MKKRIGIIVVAALIMALSIGLITYTNMSSGQGKKYFDLGQKYLSELNYEQAIAQFTKALEISPDDEAVKEALVTTYMAWAEDLVNKGDVDGALKVLQQGIDSTGDQRLKDMLSSLQAQNTPVKEPEPAEEEYQLSDEDREYLLSIARGEVEFLNGFQAGQYEPENVEGALAAADELVYSLENTDRFREICKNWQKHSPNKRLSIKDGDIFLIARSYDTDHVDINVGSDGNGWFIGSAIQHGFHSLIIAPYVDGKANGKAYFYNTAYTQDRISSMSISDVVNGVTQPGDMLYAQVGQEPEMIERTVLDDPDWWPDWYEFGE